MTKRKSEIVCKGLKFSWYGYAPVEGGGGGLGIRMSRHKKTRSFFAVLSVADVKELHAFLGRCLKKG